MIGVTQFDEHSQVKALFRQLPLNHELSLYGKRNILGHELYVAGMRLIGGNYLIIVTPNYPGSAIRTYAYRWEIETFFHVSKGEVLILKTLI